MEFTSAPVDQAAVAERLKAAVQGVCRVRVDEVGFGEVNGGGGG